jgi:aryl-alcohol dehydrogenase-like predicted oxidoreductase
MDVAGEAPVAAVAVTAGDFGATGLRVGRIGLGAGPLGDPALDERDVDRLIGTALDLGIDLIDTARSYGVSEDRLGRHLEGRRERVVLSTKVGYDMPGVADWTGPCIDAGVDAALRRLRTDRIDIVHLHSCPVETLQRGDVIDALDRARVAGKIRVAAYSGDNAALDHAVATGVFGSIQCSLSVCDQAALESAVPRARDVGLGVIAKRPLANVAWRAPDSPYAERWRALALDLGELSAHELAVRFAAFSTGAHAILIGTRSADHLRDNVTAVAAGPLPAAVVEQVRAAWRRHAWPGWI